RSGIPHEVHAYEAPERHGNARMDRPAYGIEAAAALGIDPRSICKTLVVDADGELMVAIVPVDAELDLRRFAEEVGARRASLAEPRVAERATGYVIGGISPLGTTRRLRTVVDAAVVELERVHVSAGRRGLQVELSPTDLVTVTGATVADITRTD
ncbi:MAG: aminoacyl-tRNA deacylase, partial [Candidatus Limnocylindrales bacterium]